MSSVSRLIVVLLLPFISISLDMEDRPVADLVLPITGKWLMNSREERRSGEYFISIILSDRMEKRDLQGSSSLI